MPHQHTLATEEVPWTDLKPHPDNPRNGDTDAIAQSLQVNGQYRPIVVARDGTILAGNHTYAAAGQLGWASMAVVRLDLDPGSPEARRIMLADNRTADLGTYDDTLLLALLESLPEPDGTGYTPDDLDVLRERLDALDQDPIDLDKYTWDVRVPQYEPTAPEPPPHTALYDTAKADALRAAIEADPDLDPDTRAFLAAAAARHIKFTYSQIAEFYAHAPAAVQAHMEASALVIIDLDDAIANGYAKLASWLDESHTTGTTPYEAS